MPTLNWIGKAAVVKHHKAISFRLLEPVPELSFGDAASDNLNALLSRQSTPPTRVNFPTWEDLAFIRDV